VLQFNVVRSASTAVFSSIESLEPRRLLSGGPRVIYSSLRDGAEVFDDISSVAVAFAIDLDDGVVASARIGLGGVAATPIRARATEAALTGRSWDRETVRDAASVLATEGTPMSDHRASAEYRSLMLGTALLKLHRETATVEGVPA